MAEWQPISTAPKGDDLLVFCPEAREPRVIVAALLEYEDGSESWLDVWYERDLEVEPTHWMICPSDPVPNNG